MSGIYQVYTMIINFLGFPDAAMCMRSVNPWLWQFGRGKPRLGGLSVEKTDDRKEAAQKERLLRGAETRQRHGRKADLACQ